MPNELTVVYRVLIAFALSFGVGFERGLRGSAAGDRTFSLVGASAAALTAIFYKTTPQAVAGIISGIGFIGGGVVFHGQGSLVRGVTTAATVFGTAAIGVVVGTGEVLAGVLLAGLFLLVLEVRHLPVLRCLDAARYREKVKQDSDYQVEHQQ